MFNNRAKFANNLSTAATIGSVEPLNWCFKFVNLSHYCYLCQITTNKL